MLNLEELENLLLTYKKFPTDFLLDEIINKTISENIRKLSPNYQIQQIISRLIQLSDMKQAAEALLLIMASNPYKWKGGDDIFVTFLLLSIIPNRINDTTINLLIHCDKQDIKNIGNAIIKEHKEKTNPSATVRLASNSAILIAAPTPQIHDEDDDTIEIETSPSVRSVNII